MAEKILELMQKGFTITFYPYPLDEEQLFYVRLSKDGIVIEEILSALDFYTRVPMDEMIKRDLCGMEKKMEIGVVRNNDI